MVNQAGEGHIPQRYLTSLLSDFGFCVIVIGCFSLIRVGGCFHLPLIHSGCLIILMARRLIISIQQGSLSDYLITVRFHPISVIVLLPNYIIVLLLSVIVVLIDFNVSFLPLISDWEMTFWRSHFMRIKGVFWRMRTFISLRVRFSLYPRECKWIRNDQYYWTYFRHRYCWISSMSY